jgi:hypothetical protein
MKPLVRIANVQAEIQIRHFPNISQECYLYANPFLVLNNTLPLVLTLHFLCDILSNKSWDCSAGIVTPYGLDVQDNRVQFLAGAWDSSFLQVSRTAVRSIQPPVVEALSLRVKQ